MRTLLTADWHLHPWREFATIRSIGKKLTYLPKTPANSRLLDGIEMGAQLLQAVETHRVHQIVHAGDLVHRQGAVPTEALVFATAFLREIKNRGIPVIFAPGNHDHADRSGEYHTLQVLSNGGLVKIPDAQHGYRIYGGKLVTFDYCDDAKKLERRIDKACKTLSVGQCVAIFHHGFKGARVGTMLEYVVKEPIDAAALGLSQRFKRVFSGHYHHRQPIAGCSNGQYIGSPMELTRSDIDETNESKGFLLYDDEKDMLTTIPVVGMPRFVKLSQTELDADDLRSAVGNFCDVSYHEYSGGPDALRKRLFEAGAAGVNLLPAPKPEKARAGSAKVGSSPDKLLRQHVKAKTGKLNGKLLSLGRELLSEADKD